MAHDVFVSYPHADKATADAVVNALESSGTRCWVAPRDVSRGSDWAGAIIDAIEHSRLVVLVFSDNTNESDHILREVRAAGDANLPILPFRTTEAEPNPALKYYIGGTHWLDALTRPLEEHLDELAGSVSLLLGKGEAKEPSLPETAVPLPPPSEPWWRRLPKAAWVGGGVGVLALVIVIGAVIASGESDDNPATDAGAAVPAVSSPESTTPATEPASDPDSTIPDATAAPSAQPQGEAAFAFVLANRDGPNPVCSVTAEGEVQCELVDGVQSTEAVAVADFDGDGRADLAFANTGEAADGSAVDPLQLARNRVCLATTTGWTCSDIATAGRNSGAIAAADLDGDGFQDIVVGNASNEPGLFPEFAQLCLGDGAGGFTSCNPLGDEFIDGGGQPAPEQIAIADVNLDGDLDIAIAMFNWQNILCLGDGLGDFVCSDVEEEGAFTSGVAVGDFVGSPLLDLVLTNYGTPNRLCAQESDGSFACRDISPPGYPNATVANLPSLGGDGYADFLIGRFDSNSAFDLEDEDVDQVCVTDGTGDVTVSCSPAEDGESQVFAIQVADLNGDGYADYLRGGGGVTACLGDGAGAWSCSTIDIDIGRDDRGFSLPLQDVDIALLP